MSCTSDYVQRQSSPWNLYVVDSDRKSIRNFIHHDKDYKGSYIIICGLAVALSTKMILYSDSWNILSICEVDKYNVKQLDKVIYRYAKIPRIETKRKETLRIDILTEPNDTYS